MRAFLSHSSKDKEFVRAVAKELGRQFCLFDEQAFDSGREFLDSIRRGLDDSDVFVLFATRKALESVWVSFEAREAEFRILQRHMNTALVFILESSVDLEDLPDWLRRTTVKKVNAPRPVAREIRFHIDEIVRDKQQPFFVGRARDIALIQQRLSPFDGSAPPRVLTVSGLPGIGRRTVVSRISRDTLNLPRQLMVRIEAGDSIRDLALKIADRVEPYITQVKLQQIQEAIQSSTDTQVRDRVIADLRTAVANGELPVFFDDGGLIDNEGRLAPQIVEIVSHIQEDDDVYLFLISARRPYQATYGAGIDIPSILLKPLSPDDTKVLISSIANRANLRLTAPQISELAEYVGGFPPAAYFALQLVRDYGIDLILKEKSRLVEFRASSFLRYLKRLDLDDNDKCILQFLAAYSPLPLRVLGEVMNLTAEDLSATVAKLIDSALVVPDEFSYYWLSDPIVNAVTREFGHISNDGHAAVAASLKNYLKENDLATPVLELSRVLYRALAISGREEDKSYSLHLVSDWVRLETQLYHRRQFEEAAKFGELAVAARPEGVDARNYLIRALIQEEQWDRATHHLEVLRRQGMVREAYFLEGFMMRKRGYFKKATEAYAEAVSRGWQGSAVQRELALCFLELDDLENARKHIDEARKVALDDRYVVDLQIIIATKQQDEAAARKRLETLEAIDDPAFYRHRLSTVEFAFKNYAAAYQAAMDAFNRSPYPGFEMTSQLIKCQIQTGHLKDAAELLRDLDSQYKHTRRDDRLRLRIRWETASRKWENALATWDKLENKGSTVHKMLKRDALSGLLRDSALSDTVRAHYEAELVDLGRQLSSSSVLDLDVDFDA